MQLGDNSPFTRDTAGASPERLGVFDPIALEDRLRIAREQRAEAIARRQTATRPAIATTRQASRLSASPPPDCREDSSGPCPARGASTSGAPSARSGRGLRRAVIPPACSVARLRGQRRVHARAQRAGVTRRPRCRRGFAAGDAPGPPGQSTARGEVASAATPTGSASASVESPLAAAAMAPSPAASAEAPASTSQVSSVPAAPLAGPAVPPDAAAPRPQRVLVNAPKSVPTDAIDAALATLRETGFAEVAAQQTRLTIRASTVRYYNAEDASAAAEVAALVGPSLPGGVAEARDFSDAPSRGAPGHLEVWVAGAPPASKERPSPPSEPVARPGIDPEQIRRLVESVITPDSWDLGSATFARGVELLGAGSPPGIGSAVTDQVRSPP